MPGRVRGHIRSNVVGYVALFFALGLGGAWAATGLEKSSVKSKHIRNNGVKTKDLADGAVSSPKVSDGSLLGEDFAPGQLPAGERGPQGERGLQGPQGDEGPPGPPGPATGSAGGDLSGSYPNPALRAPEAWTDAILPATNEDGHFGSGWRNRPNGTGEDFNTVGFFRDRQGIVHLKGLAQRPDGFGSMILNLPSGYTPAHTEIHAVMVGDGVSRVTIKSNGAVELVSGDPSTYVVLDGIAFRCGPSGSHGCP